MDRIVFIPFAQPYADEFLERTDNWIKERPEKNFRVVVYNPMRAQLNFDGHPMLKNLVKGSAIYIRGHGLPGATAVTTSLNGNHVSLPITEAIDRLLEMGLESSFRGKIKFYSCYSGLAQPPKYKGGGETYAKKNGDIHARGGNWEPKSQALAKTGASYFRSLGFKLCKFYGYLGPLTGKYEQSDTVDSGTTHKFCEITEFSPLGDKIRVDTNNRITRASDARKSF